MRVINNSTSAVGLPGIGSLGAGEFVEATEEQVKTLESLPIVAHWIRSGAIAIDRGSVDLDVETEPESAEYWNG